MLVRRASLFSVVFVGMLAAAASVEAAPGGAALTPIVTTNVPHGNLAVLYHGGIVRVEDGHHRTVGTRYLAEFDDRLATAIKPDAKDLAGALALPPRGPFAEGSLVVVLRPGTISAQPVVKLDQKSLDALLAARPGSPKIAPPPYTNDVSLNETFASLHVDRVAHLLTASRFATLRPVPGMLPFNNAYVVHQLGTSVPQAVARLRSSPSVLYASPHYYASPLHAPARRLTAAEVRRAARPAATAQIGSPAAGTQTIPTNFAVRESGQAMLNARGLNAIAAFDEIGRRFHQLPGQGEIVTNVSLTDLETDAEIRKAPCGEAYLQYYEGYGGTTIVSGGQRYLDWPSMPLIPTFTADSSGTLDPLGATCGQDSLAGEVGLDFSMMSALPHDRQRPGRTGNGVDDLLGVAPGASYRLVVPKADLPTYTDIDIALLAAASQQPRPDVITASLGFGFDAQGFPSRYLEDDPLSEAVIAAIVNEYHVVVCVAANDGLRTYTNSAISPSGGAAPTDVTAQPSLVTNLNDIAYSTQPSIDFDSGSIDAGSTTVDDLYGGRSGTHPVVRWDGGQTYSSGFGTRVNVAGPSDEVLSIFGTVDSPYIAISGGTSAAAPQAAASAAIALQVARLSGHPLRDPLAVRSLLEDTGTPVEPVAQTDVITAVGPQLNLGHLVETLLGRAGARTAPSVPRVGIFQHQSLGRGDPFYLTATDPSSIDLTGPNAFDGLVGENEFSPITIAPDWENLPAGATYRLSVAKNPARLLATAASARLLPAQILGAVGEPLAGSGTRSVTLTYRALLGTRVLAEKTFTLTFGPTLQQLRAAPAPEVPAVVSGTTIPVRYDLGAVVGAHPKLVVSEPGRPAPYTSSVWRPSYVVDLPAKKGTLEVPVAKLRGTGIYGVAISLYGQGADFLCYPQTLPCTQQSFTRVMTTKSSARPAAPLLSTAGVAPGHVLEVPWGTPFSVSWDVANVPRASGAVLEIGPGGPGIYGTAATFDNPNGSLLDRNGVDNGSVYALHVSGTHGVVTIDPLKAGLYASLVHSVRVFPTAGLEAVGEAGEISTVSMDGIVPPSGGSGSVGGFDTSLDLGATNVGVNQHGMDGYVVSARLTDDNHIASSLAIFDTRTNTIGNVIFNRYDSAANAIYYTSVPGVGAMRDDLGMFQTRTAQIAIDPVGLIETITDLTHQDALLKPIASGTIRASINSLDCPPLAPFNANDTGTSVGCLSYDFTTGINLTTFDVVSGKTTGPFALPDSSPSNYTEGYGSLTYDLEGDRAFVGRSGVNAGTPGGSVVTLDLKTGSARASSRFPIAIGYPDSGLAYDPKTDRLGVAEGCCSGDPALIVLQPPAAGFRQTPLSGIFPTGIAADEVNHLFLVAELLPAGFFLDNNSLGVLDVFDENGRKISSSESLGLFGAYSQPLISTIQANPATRTIYVPSALTNEEQPVRY